MKGTETSEDRGEGGFGGFGLYQAKRTVRMLSLCVGGRGGATFRSFFDVTPV
jgi:hypothetical protein